MATMYYPDDVPTKQTIRRLLRTQRRVWISMNSTVVNVRQGGNIVLGLPKSYRTHLQRFVWREHAIRSVLGHAEELKLNKNLEDNLVMLMFYMDNVFKRIVTESASAFVQESTYRSKTFDSYLVIEYYVRRHEPTNVRQWRRENDSVLELKTVDECNWQQYETEVGGIWAGGRMQYDMTKQATTLQFARGLLKEISAQYNPPVSKDFDFGYTYTEHLRADTPNDEEEDQPGPSNSTGGGTGSGGAVGNVKGKKKNSRTNDDTGDVGEQEDGQGVTRGKGKGKATATGKVGEGKGKGKKGKGKGNVRSKSYVSDEGSDEGSVG